VSVVLFCPKVNDQKKKKKQKENEFINLFVCRDVVDIAVAAKEVSLSNKLQNFLSDDEDGSAMITEPNSMSASVGVHGNEVVNDGKNDAKVG
jgi:hypothetical protein